MKKNCVSGEKLRTCTALANSYGYAFDNLQCSCVLHFVGGEKHSTDKVGDI